VRELSLGNVRGRASRYAGECDEVQFTVAGSIGSDNPKYARKRRDEIVIALVRYEIQYLDTPILPIESATEVEDIDITSDTGQTSKCNSVESLQ
jgi:hypothetical protein